MLGIPFLDDAIWKWFKPQALDDPVDRLNYFITATLLAFFAIMVSAKQYVGSPIQCWMPMEFKGGWEQYAEDYCFIQNTYFLPFHEDIPNEIDERGEAEIGYYQWVPIVLALQAIMFYIPNWLWKTLNQQSGIDLDTAVADARKLRSCSSENRKKEVARLADYLGECLEFGDHKRAPAKFFCFRIGYGLGSYVSMLYLGVKFMYLVNIVLQFVLLNHFLSPDYTFWGFQTFVDLYNGKEWMDSGMFPRVTLCDFRIRRLANIHRYTVQCVMMINMFNEKIYLFIWFWFVFVAVSTVINFLYCAANLIPTSLREKTTRTWLSHYLSGGAKYGADQMDYHQDSIVRRFTHRGLRPDGVLLLRFIEGHAGAIVARELASKLYQDYLEQASTYGMPPTKSTTPGGIEDGPRESLYPHDKMHPLMAPDYPTKH